MKDTEFEDSNQKSSQDNDHIIDVVADFECSQQDHEYNSAYKKWRANKNNSFAYNYVNDTREHSYIDGVGFVDNNPEQQEQKSLSKNIFIIGSALIIILFIETFGEFLVTSTMAFFGSKASWTITGGLINATEGTKICINYIVKILEWGFPIFLFKYIVKMPWNVIMPIKVSNPTMNKISVPFTLVIFVIVTYFNILYDKVLSVFNIDGVSTEFFCISNNLSSVLMVFLQLLIVPILSEIFFRGVILQNLRQFGDGYALIISSLISAVLIHKIGNISATFVMALVIGYFVLLTGSIYTGIVMRIVYISCKYVRFIVESSFTAEIATTINVSLSLVCIVAGIIMIVFLARKQECIIHIEFNKTFLSLKEKLILSISSSTIIIWMIFSFILTLSSIRFIE